MEEENYSSQVTPWCLNLMRACHKKDADACLNYFDLCMTDDIPSRQFERDKLRVKVGEARKAGAPTVVKHSLYDLDPIVYPHSSEEIKTNDSKQQPSTIETDTKWQPNITKKPESDWFTVLFWILIVMLVLIILIIVGALLLTLYKTYLNAGEINFETWGAELKKLW